MGQLLSDEYYFSRRIAEEIARARRSGTRFSVVLFTSQPADDELPEVACVRSLPALLASVRDTDTVCRVQRDTIAVLLIDAGADGSRAAALRLLGRLDDQLGHWRFTVLDYPERESKIEELLLIAA